MWVLIGTEEHVYQERIGESFKTDYIDVEICLFSSREKGEQYIEKALLKNPQRQTFAGDKVFRSRSLLVNCTSARIEEYHEEELEVDPTI